MKNKINFLITVLSLSAACASTSQMHIPKFMVPYIQNGQANRMKLYLNDQGVAERVTLYVQKEAVPEWVYKKADSVIGEGVDQNYEVELYENGDQVYEISRLVKERVVKVSFKFDQTLRYVERKYTENDVPEGVKNAVRNTEYFTAADYGLREGPGIKAFFVTGEAKGESQLLVVNANDLTTQRQRYITGTFALK